MKRVQNRHAVSLRFQFRSFLNRLRLLGLVRWLRKLPKMLTDPEYRRQEHARNHRARIFHEQYIDFKEKYGGIFEKLALNNGIGKKALVISTAEFPFFYQVELAFVKALELANYETSLLLMPYSEAEWGVSKYYELSGVKEIYTWSDYYEPIDPGIAGSVLENINTTREMLALERTGARVGKFAYTSALRSFRLGSLDFQSSHDCQILQNFLEFSIGSVDAAKRIIQEVHPDVLLLLNSLYTPEGELVDVCLNAGIDVILYEFSHKSGSLIFKRYKKENLDDHPATLSELSWKLVREMKWTDSCREQLQREFQETYASRDWYSACCTQFNTSFSEAENLRSRLGLNSAKKTAFIFPHVSWDASLMWGDDLFDSYEEFLLETVRAACRNSQVNWVIKIHPAYAGKNAIEGKQGEASDLVALRRNIGILPEHIFVIPPESDISTYSLYAIMDYCITVRGTVGIEAARLGIPVLTAGTGRYDRRGFTIDSESREQYLKKINQIEDIPRLSKAQQELAERFAYGLFILRPFPLSTVTFKNHKDFGMEKRFLKTQINIRDNNEWAKAPDLKKLAEWINDQSQLDLLVDSDKE